MIVVAVILLAVVILLVAAGLHTGPHGFTASGIIAVAGSVAVAVALVVLARGVVVDLTWALVLGAVAVSAGAFAAGVKSIAGMRGRPALSDTRSLLGADAVAVTSLVPSGTVRVRGETWSAVSLSGTVPQGSQVHVAGVEGLRLEVWSDAGVAVSPADVPREVGQP